MTKIVLLLTATITVAFTAVALSQKPREDTEIQSNQYGDAITATQSPTTSIPAAPHRSPPMKAHQEDALAVDDQAPYRVSSNMETNNVRIAQLADSAVDRLDAEVTGRNQSSYAHLDGQTQPCCEALEVHAVAVIDSPDSEVIKVIIDWSATYFESEVTRNEVSTTFWRQQPDGEMEFVT